MSTESLGIIISEFLMTCENGFFYFEKERKYSNILWRTYSLIVLSWSGINFCRNIEVEEIL